MFIYNVFLTFSVKRLTNGIFKMFLKHSITNGFRTHHFLTFETFPNKRLQNPKMFTGNMKFKYYLKHRRLLVESHCYITYCNRLIIPSASAL